MWQQVRRMTRRDLLALACAIALLPAIPAGASAEEIKIGGTGAALGTMRLIVKEYGAKHPQVRITIVPNLGSGGGIKAVLAGAIDLAMTSRTLKEVERQLGAVESEYARTPLVFAVAAKSPVNAITREELADIYAGARTKWPDGTPIRVILRPASDIDSDMVKSISPEMRRGVSTAEERPGIRIALNDQMAADDLERISGAVGPSALSLIVSEKRALKALRLDGVQPALQNVANPAYPYFKRLLFVTGSKRSATVEEFIAFVNSSSGNKILRANGHWLP